MMKWMKKYLPGERLAVLSFDGLMMARSVAPYLRLLRLIERSRFIKGLLLQVDSPGGSAAASEMLYFSLKRLAEKKTVYCYTLMAASGGYMVACGAKRIFSPHTGLLGSIGVLSVKPVLKDVMEKLGVRLEVMKKGASKDMSLFHRELTDEEKARLEELHDDLYQRFIDIIVEGRGLSRERVSEMATGELYSAKKSLVYGLIDEIADMETALERLSSETGVKKENTVYLKVRKPLMRQFMASGMAAAVDELYSLLISEYYRNFY